MPRENDPKRRVVVTGLGVVSSIGIGWQEFWKNLIAGKSGISKITAFDTSKYDRHYGGEVRNFNPRHFQKKGNLICQGSSSQFAIAATRLALEDSKLKAECLRSYGTAVLLGTTMGETQDIQKVAEKCLVNKKINPLLGLRYPASTIPQNLSRLLLINSRNMIFSNACAAGNFAIAFGYDQIKRGKVDFAICGGVDSFSRIAFTGFSRLFNMASKLCQPFDRKRGGMILGEGAGILILETLQRARKRKARIYAEISSCGFSCNSTHMTIPATKGMASAIAQSLRLSPFRSEDVDYISAHGTGTIENDKAECEAFAKVFGDRLKKIPCSSIKSMLGHTLGAASAIESVSCCLSIHESIIPPTINLCYPDPQCNIDCVPNKARKAQVRIAINNSSAFGGNNAVLMFNRL